MSQLDNGNKAGRSRSSQGSRSTASYSRNASTGRSGSSGRTSSTGRSAGAGSGSRQSSGRNGQTVREAATRQGQKNNKRRRRPPVDYTKIAIGVVALLIVVICMVLLGKGFSKKTGITEETAVTTEKETELKKEVVVEGVTITGMSKEKAREAVLLKLNWDMKVAYKEETYELKNLLEEKVDELLTDVFSANPKDSYTLSTEGLEEAVKAEVKAIASKWDVPAQNGAISSFDKESGKFSFAGEQTGVVIKQDQLTADIMKNITEKSYQGTVQAASEEVAPELSEAQARDLYTTIGTFSTTTTSNKDRNTNISLACDALNGLIIQPGQEFSFNKTTGNRTTERGYKPAGAYVNGVLVEEPGGGVCQVSSTLYNSVVFSGLKTTERHAHSYEPSYVIPGEDAMVSYDGYAGPDMKFVNNSKDAVGIKASFSKQKLTISIVGIPILEEGVTLSMTSKKTGEVAPPAPTYVEDQTLQPGVEVEAKKATSGSRWVTNLITKKNGEIVSDEFFHNSSYKGKPATIKRNTSGVVVPSVDPSAPSESVGTDTSGSAAAPSESESQNSGGNQNGPGGITQPTQPTQPTQATQPTQPTQPNTGTGQGSAGPGTEPATAAPGGDSGIIPPNPMS